MFRKRPPPGQYLTWNTLIICAFKLVSLVSVSLLVGERHFRVSPLLHAMFLVTSLYLNSMHTIKDVSQFTQDVRRILIWCKPSPKMFRDSLTGLESKLYMEKILGKTRNTLMLDVNLVRLVSACCLDTRSIKGPRCGFWLSWRLKTFF